jgi:Uncharacterized conserved protein
MDGAWTMTDRTRDREEEGDLLTRTRQDKPKRYKVLLHNDDYTTMEFVEVSF